MKRPDNLEYLAGRGAGVIPVARTLARYIVLLEARLNAASDVVETATRHYCAYKFPECEQPGTRASPCAICQALAVMDSQP